MSPLRHHAWTSTRQGLRQARRHKTLFAMAVFGAWLCVDAVGTLVLPGGAPGFLDGMRTGLTEAFGGMVAAIWILATGSSLLVFLAGRWGAMPQGHAVPTLPLGALPRALAETASWLGLVLIITGAPRLLAGWLLPEAVSRSGAEVLLATALAAWVLGAWMTAELWGALVQRPAHVYQTILACAILLVAGLLLDVPPVLLLVGWPVVLAGAVAVAGRCAGRLSGSSHAHQGHAVRPYRPARSVQEWRDVFGSQAWYPSGVSRAALGGTAGVLVGLAFILGWQIGWDDLGATLIFWMFPWLFLWARPLGFRSVDLRQLQARMILLPVHPGRVITAATVQRLLFGCVVIGAAALTGPLLAQGAALSAVQWTLASFALVIGTGSAAMGLGAARGALAGAVLALVATLGSLWLILASGLLPGPGVWTLQVFAALAALVAAPTIAALPWMLRPRPIAL